MIWKFYKTKSFVYLGTVAVVFMLVFFLKQYSEKLKIEREIATLEQEVLELEKHNTEISQMISYLQTTQFQERQARALLNLQKPGEFAVALPFLPDNSENQNLEENNEYSSNFIKWWNYFFRE